MSLIKPDIEPEILRAFTSGLGDYIDSSDPLWSLLLNKHNAISAYNLTLETFIEPQARQMIKLENLEAVLAKTHLPQTGWRFLAAEGDLYAGCHVGSISAGHPPRLTGLSTDPRILTAIEGYGGLGAVALPPNLPPGDFKPRALRIPWLQFEVFWLHSTGAECDDCIDYHLDYFVPYAGFIGTRHYGLDLMTSFTVKDFFGEGTWGRIGKAVGRYLKQQFEDVKAQAGRARALVSGQEAAVQALKTKAAHLEAQIDRANQPLPKKD